VSDLSVVDDVKKMLMQGAFNSNGFPMPFTKEIFLVACHVAGTGYRDVKTFEPELKIDNFLIFKREPENPHDVFAIAIFNENGTNLGYVPKVKNEILARLMDSGKFVFGKLVSKEWVDDWLRIDIRIFMRDF
jgi:hypothetical protein